MTISVEEYTRLTKKVDELKEQAQQAKGVLSSLMVDLKEDFECDTQEEGEKLLEELSEKKDKLEAEYNTELKAFKEKYGEQLEI